MSYSTIRDSDLLGPIIGQRCVEVTQHDAEEFEENGESRIYLHFENGMTVSFPIEDAGFTINDPNRKDDDDDSTRDGNGQGSPG